MRIIGGRWRGRKIAFPVLAELRPTADSARETLFNWLAGYIEGTRCLDLFAGSGALGLEALSRGAASAHLIDASRLTVKYLHDNLQRLGADNGHVLLSTAQAWLQRFNSHQDQPYDIIFLDPPFRQPYVGDCATMIEQNRLLSDAGWVYLEMEADAPLPVLPQSWQLYQEKQVGQVCYRLFRQAGCSEHDKPNI